jgi:hypothetical protein
MRIPKCILSGTLLRALFLTMLFDRVASAAVAQQATSAPLRQPVLVELFTSEGCSDCPPADALLARLDSTQFVPGAQAIVLSEHVTYWDHQGWRDPFSLEEMTSRQEQYVHRFGLDSSYTPQMVVDGATQLVGNNAQAMSRAVAIAAAAPKKTLEIRSANWASGTVLFSVRGAEDSSTRLVAALAEDATHAEVSRGENAGRTLHHVAVVRVMKEFGSDALDGRQLRLTATHVPDGDDSKGTIRLVVFQVDHKSGRVVAAAEQTLHTSGK